MEEPPVFSIHEILALAVQLESNAERRYRNAAARHADPRLAELLTWMADEERAHAQWFKAQEALIPQETPSEMADTMSRGLLTEIVKDQQFSLADRDLDVIEEVPEMLKVFAEFENDTIIFYKLLLPFVGDDTTREALESIIREEKRHLQELSRILDQEAAEANA
jgi:rubrerythrin